MGGLAAAKRGECDIAGVHLLDPATGEYNRPLLTERLSLVPGYGRMQGIVYRRGDARFEGKRLDDSDCARRAQTPDCVMVNRNAGSGTRIIVDKLLGDTRPAGLRRCRRNRTTRWPRRWRRGARTGASRSTPWPGNTTWDSSPLQEERYDFIVPTARLERPAVRAFCALLDDPQVREELIALGFRLPRDTPS